jgi:drug/metabolite transporter (DMT)-like permease
MRHQASTVGVLALVATAVLWGSNHVVARGVHEVVPLAALVFWRWAIALVLLTPVALGALGRSGAEIRDNLADLVFIGAVGVGLFSLFLIAGAYYSLAIEVGMINATTPAWVAVILVVTGQARVAPSSWLGLAVAFAGTALIMTRGSPEVLLALDVRLGNLWALVAAVLFAWFSIRLRRYSGRIEPLALTVVTSAAGLVLVALPFYLGSLLIAESPVLVRDPDQLSLALWAVGYIALGPTMIANFLYVFGVSRVGPERAAAFIYLSPVASSVLSVIFLGEAFLWFHLVGFILILGGLAVMNRGSTEDSRE